MKPYRRKILFLAFATFLLLFGLRGNAQENLCQDSDLGTDYYKKGEIKIAGDIVWEDKCLNPTQLQEGYCDPKDSSKTKSFIFNCFNGCQDGVCSKDIKILSPSGGENLKEGDNYSIRWEGRGLDGNDEVQISVIRSDGLRGDIAKVSASEGFYSWKAETDLKDWYFDPSTKGESLTYPLLDRDSNFYFQYKVLITSLKTKVSVYSDRYFDVIKRPGVDLVLGENFKDEHLGFSLQVCNKGNKDLDFQDKTIKAKITVYSGEGDKNIEKTVSLIGAELQKGECKDSSVISYIDFEMKKKMAYKTEVVLDPDNEFDELYEGDKKTYDIIPKIGVEISSPGDEDRWGIGSRHRIVFEVGGPEIWTKVDIKAINQDSGEEYPIDTIHLYPPQMEYWWTIPENVPLGEHYIIKTTSDDTEVKEVESENFAIIEPQVSCSDSDKGKDYYKKAEISGIFIALRDTNEERSALDFCIDDNTLVEYFCKDDYVNSEHFDCPFGCEDGACKKAINLIAPNGKENLKIGDNCTIKWEAPKVSADTKIQIKLEDKEYESDADKKETLIAEAPNTGSYDWLISQDIEPTKNEKEPDYKIGLYLGGEDFAQFDESDGYFSITQKPATTVAVKKNKSAIILKPATTTINPKIEEIPRLYVDKVKKEEPSKKIQQPKTENQVAAIVNGVVQVADVLKKMLGK